jgi:hypothetical protein
LNVHRSAMLLRCQRGREDRRRVALLRAEQASRAAAAAEISARERCDAHIVFRSSKMAEAHEAVRGCVVDLEALRSLSTLEQSLQEEAAALQSALTDAAEKRRTAEAAVADASIALQFETRITHRRERMADRMRIRATSATEIAAEAERDEQSIESWSAG